MTEPERRTERHRGNAEPERGLPAMILVVDDSRTNLFLLEQILKGRGYRVATAGDGADALQCARQSPPDLIVTDILMPVMDGFSLCWEWKRDERLKRIPLICYTGTYTDDRNRRFALELGAERFVVNTGNPEDLIKVIRQVLAPRQHSDPSEVSPDVAEKTVYLRQHNESLARKLDDKVRQLEQAHRGLQRDVAARIQAEKANAQLAAIIESSNDAIISRTLDLTILTWNAGAERLFGWSAEEAIGRNVNMLIPPELKGEAARSGARLREGRPLMPRDTVRITKDGRRIDVSLTHSPIKNERGDITGVSIVFHDIGERKRTEAARVALEAQLREREHLMRLVTEGVPAMIAYFDRDLRCRFANAAYCEFRHLDSQGIIGRTLREITGEDAYRVTRPSIDIVEQGRPVTQHRRERTAAGETRHLEIHRVPDMSPGGEFRGYYVMVLDITERKLAEETREKLAAIVENSNDAIYSRTLDGTVLSWNAGAEKMLGYTAAETLGKSIAITLPPHRPPNLARNNETLLRGEVIARESDRITKDGRVIDVLTSHSPIRDHAGNIVGASTILQDITALKQAQSARASLEAQLRESQKLEAVGTLASGIAHDFNNILGAIIGNAALARQDVGANHRAQVSLEEISKAAQRAKELVQQILAFGRKQPQQLLILPLRPAVEDAVKLLRATLPASIEIVTTISDLPLYVHADATQIQQVLLNLGANAWHAMEGRPGRIVIGLDAVLLDAAAANTLSGLQPGPHACLRVSDNGCGMDAATQARIFEPFFTTKAVGQGTGLGLSVVHGIVKAHQGAISLASTPGEGATFQIYFPAVGEPQVEVPPEPAVPSPARGRGQHVLYVDDDEAMVFLVTRMLEGLGYRISGYERGEDALEAVRADAADFDLVVTDFNMPGLSGLEVAQELARIRPELPVVIASGYITEELRANALQAGVHHLVYKPNTIDELCEVIQRLLTTARA